MQKISSYSALFTFHPVSSGCTYSYRTEFRGVSVDHIFLHLLAGKQIISTLVKCDGPGNESSIPGTSHILLFCISIQRRYKRDYFGLSVCLQNNETVSYSNQKKAL